MTIVDDVFKITTKGFDFKKKQGDRLRGAYVRRRAEYLHLHNSSWSVNRIAGQLKSEIVAIQDYIAAKDPLINDTENAPLGHLELRIGAALITLSIDHGSFGQTFFDGIRKEARANRVRWVIQIVWRAVAISSDVMWQSLGPPPRIAQAALDEILDRRLRVVEMMHFWVNSAGYGHLGRLWKISGPNGPWMDGFRIRSFEYPWVQPAEPFDTVLNGNPEWHRDVSLTPAGLLSEFNFDPPNHVRVRIPGKSSAAWKLSIDRTWINFHPITSLPPADMIQDIFIPRADFWDRCWLFCDQVGSLLNIEALWFATRRRTTKDDTFNTVMRRPDYVRLGPVVGDKHDRDILMADDTDAFFENTAVDLDDLQIGDFVRFWNSRVYELWPPYAGAWGSEFSLVMGIEVNGTSGKVERPLLRGPQVWLAGHGMHTVLYETMAAEAIEHLKTRYFAALRVVLSGNGTPDRKVDQGHVYVRWTPYENFDDSDPWWVEIPKATWHDEWGYNTQTDVLNGIPRTIAKENGGTGYSPPPNPDAVYFPLHEPAVDHTDADGDSWRAYLRQRKANSSFRLKSTSLKPLSIDARLAPGLFYRGAKATIAVVRPRVRI